MRYRVQILPHIESLESHQSPSSLAKTTSNYAPGNSFIVDDQSVDMEGNLWFKIEGSSEWIPFRLNGKSLLKIVYQYSGNSDIALLADDGTTTSAAVTSQFSATVDTSSQSALGTVVAYSTLKPVRVAKLPKRSVYSVKDLKDIRGNSYTKQTWDYDRSFTLTEQNQNGYPTIVQNNDNGKLVDETNTPPIYDYTISAMDLDDSVDVIRKNLNIPSLYNQRQLNRLMHKQFNRFRIAYPDYERGPLIPYVFVTRPDLNLFNDDGTLLRQIYSNPQLQYLIETNDLTAKSLTQAYTSEHDFIPILCNRIGSLDMQDFTLDTSDMGETFTGYKAQYSKNGIRSLTAGTLSIKFPETYNMALTALHQIWCGYESAVYTGRLDPKEEYMCNKILDYAVAIYYFLADKDGILRFWSKYFGCFPTNVNESIFSYDSGSLVQFPEMNITYAYITKETMSPDTIGEFNEACKVTGASDKKYAVEHDDSLGHYGATWSGPPFIQTIYVDEGGDQQAMRFVLRYREAPSDTLIDAAVSTTTNKNLNDKQTHSELKAVLDSKRGGS